METSTALLAMLLVLAQDGPGRGEDPSRAGGALLVVGIALVVVLLAAGALFLVSRVARSRRARSAEAVRSPLPSEEGKAVVERPVTRRPRTS